MTASPTDDLASAEQRIQELTKALSQSRGDLSQARGELAEAREQQAATADILRVISSSPTDQQRVFADIAASAARLCDAHDATIFQVDDDILLPVAHRGPIPSPAHGGPLKRGFVTGHAILDRRTIQVTDLQAEPDAYPESSKLARRLGHRTILTSPLIHAGKAIGAITIRRTEVRSFTDRQVALLKTFADQAVIAIENTRLFEAEQARTRELTEALAHQTATTEILNVISRSPTQVTPVFEAIVASAAELCGAAFSNIQLYDGQNLNVVAMHNYKSEIEALVRQMYPMPPGRTQTGGRVILSRSIVQVPDILLDPEYSQEMARAGGFRSVLSVPMLRHDDPIGVISVAQPDPTPFSERQIELLKIFADQAVIAIENTRLFEEVQARTRELQEALEQQTATSEVLGVISSSPGDLEPVFQAMLMNATRLCGANFGVLYRSEGEAVRAVAVHGTPPSYNEERRRNPLVRPAPQTVLARALASRQTVQFDDVEAIPGYFDAPPGFSAAKMSKHGGARTVLVVPMLKEDELVGAIAMYRQEVRPFGDKQIQLVSSFARQAVIAIENTRLLNELRESLQQQTATADVLKVISRATFDLPRVLDTLVQSAATLCDSYDTSIVQRDGDVLRIVSRSQHVSSIGQVATVPLTRGGVAGRAVLDRQTIHLADVQSETDEYPWSSAIARRLAYHTVLAVPLVG